MALFCTPPTPMTTTLPSLPAELLQTWTSWRPRQSTGLITPPMSTALPRPAPQPHSQVSLPPITHFDRQLAVLPPRASTSFVSVLGVANRCTQSLPHKTRRVGQSLHHSLSLLTSTTTTRLTSANPRSNRSHSYQMTRPISSTGSIPR